MSSYTVKSWSETFQELEKSHPNAVVVIGSAHAPANVNDICQYVYNNDGTGIHVSVFDQSKVNVVRLPCSSEKLENVLTIVNPPKKVVDPITMYKFIEFVKVLNPLPYETQARILNSQEIFEGPFYYIGDHPVNKWYMDGYVPSCAMPFVEDSKFKNIRLVTYPWKNIIADKEEIVDNITPEINDGYATKPWGNKSAKTVDLSSIWCVPIYIDNPVYGDNGEKELYGNDDDSSTDEDMPPLMSPEMLRCNIPNPEIDSSDDSYSEDEVHLQSPDEFRKKLTTHYDCKCDYEISQKPDRQKPFCVSATELKYVNGLFDPATREVTPYEDVLEEFLQNNIARTEVRPKARKPLRRSTRADDGDEPWLPRRHYYWNGPRRRSERLRTRKGFSNNE